jgi:hypothetical protein
MFYSKKIKALKQEIHFQKIDLEGKNNILRVTLNDNRKLRKELNQKKQLLKKYQEVLMKYQEEGKL